MTREEKYPKWAELRRKNQEQLNRLEKAKAERLAARQLNSLTLPKRPQNEVKKNVYRPFWQD